MSENRNNIWAGKIVSTGALVVYDPQLQIPGQDKVNVYSVARDVMRKFVADEVREKLRPVAGPEREAALSKYREWKAVNGEEFLRQERERAAPPTRDVVVARHLARMTGRGYEYRGVRDATGRRPRSSCCWSCGDHVDNEFDIECAACGWIVCSSCGACGCGWSSPKAG